ncbi:MULTISPECIES: 1-phosphofructokinase [Staphylococcus]|uniref:1-phosphofructokinase n=1 Tax=Staphylococcus TaxID=1279 RepID=UPI0008A1B042|nr:MULTISPECIES: 1-phosphofructokinase [Staphylococcus]ARB78416.1 1-phosphofructokinase [Staphylococcus lugdunensis]MBM7132870.1 1-phosphofructokinase [Staphylococcus lugdunensis]MCH8641278.1 1-phosphofructokinase [Staphylococcus lugdunensis]MCH8644606.1 1-phosphofructokinase [Staphylococcus lugdunensis]MCH8670626.1 1-phosphofructokinase [Staphylococcus lugdunensis]
MIYTVTFNPSIDYIMFTDGFELSGLNRATITHKFAGGKGINVSRVLSTLEIPSTALGFTGGFPGEFIKDTLAANEIYTDFITVDEDTRINVKLKSGQETEINAPGPNISKQQFEALLNQIKRTTSEDVVVIAGSVPQSIPSDAYAQIARITQETGAQLVVDAEKDLVNTILPFQPLFIKPNKDELEEMFDITIQNDMDVVYYGRKILEQGAQSVIITLGGDGAIYIDQQQSIKAQNPQGKVINTVGSGDSTVAGMVAGLTSGLSIQEAFKQAVAAGTATAFNDDLATRDDIEKIKDQVTMTVLDGE